MALNIKDVNQLQTQVNNISRGVFRKAFTDMVPNFPLLGLVEIKAINDTETDFSYTPQIREYYAADGASPASCHSEAETVEVAMGDTIRGFTNKHELGYEICRTDCKDESLRDIIIKKERAVAMGLLKILADRFWVGNPALLQFGITNHPAIKHIESQPSGKSGSTKWADKTNNQVMKELRAAMKKMNNPVVLMSEEAYEDSLGNADDCNGNTCSDKLRGDAIEELLKKQDAINFKDPIRFTEELDKHPDFDGENIAIIYDRDAMSLRSSGSIWTGAYPKNGKVVKAVREINTSGLQVDYYDSVMVMTGV